MLTVFPTYIHRLEYTLNHAGYTAHKLVPPLPPATPSEKIDYWIINPCSKHDTLKCHKF